MTVNDSAGSGGAREVFQVTLRGMYLISIISDNSALKLAVENLDTGDKFGRSLSTADLAILVPEKLKTDVECLDDFEYLLVEALKAEYASTQESMRAAAAPVPGTGAEETPAIIASSQECPPDEGRSLRFTIQVRVVKGLPGRQKVHTLEIIVPVTAVATKDDAVSCCRAARYAAVMHHACASTHSKPGGRNS